MKENDVYVLGISQSVVATAAVLKNGRVLACTSEERFNHQKSCLGYPKLAVEYVLKEAGIEAKDLDLVVDSMAYGLFPSQAQAINAILASPGMSRETKELDLLSLSTFYLGKVYGIMRDVFGRIEYFFPQIKITEAINSFAKGPGGLISQKMRREEIVNHLKIDGSKVVFADHHTCHTYTAFSLNPESPSLVLSLDGMGDYLCATVSRLENGKITRLSSTPHFHSLGWVFAMVTQYLRMKPHEHEYKVMGLAPYAGKMGSAKVAEVFKKYLFLSKKEGHETEFESLYPFNLFNYFLNDKLSKFRFDLIAGGAQLFAEDLITEWVKICLQKFGRGIKSLVLTGGVFMNVKASKRIMEMPEVEKLYIVPSCGDESTAIGAGYLGYERICQKIGRHFEPKALENMYLGPKFLNTEIENEIKKLETNNKYRSEYLENIEEKVAKLLSEGKIVARMAGRMEFGARALGNRSIMARADDTDVIQIINEQIKNRDFWMPFAGTLLYERRHDYLVNPKDVDGPFMILSYDTTPLAQKHLKAAMHPYDKTIRPQILRQEQNPGYYKIIKEFENLTGMGGILNTSFNLHGDAVVCSPGDAIYTFKNSGLEYLVLENYLISKVPEPGQLGLV